MADDRPMNQERDPLWNRKAGIVAVPGSKALMELSKFEQFETKWTVGTPGPGNVYKYRPYPKMLYRAEKYGGKRVCMAPPPDSYDFADPREFNRATESARHFTERCQLIVKDEEEQQRAAENGWRESPQEAVEYLEARDKDHETEEAHRIHDDRNMSATAQREVKAEIEARGGAHLGEMPRKPVRRRGRPKGSKNKKKA